MGVPTSTPVLLGIAAITAVSFFMVRKTRSKEKQDVGEIKPVITTPLAKNLIKEKSNPLDYYDTINDNTFSYNLPRNPLQTVNKLNKLAGRARAYHTSILVI